MASRKIKGTHHVRRKLKTRVKVGIGAIAAVLVALSLVLVSKHVDSDKYSIKTVVSRIENKFAGAAQVGSVIKINTTATTDEEGNSLGYVSGGGTLINTDGDGNNLTLYANAINDGKFTGWTVNGTHFGTAVDTKITVICDTKNEGNVRYDSSSKILYVTDTADIEAVFRAPLKGAENACYVDLYITPNTGHTWIDGGPESWDGYINLDANWYGKDVQLILQYLDGGAARAVVYDENMKQISSSTGHIKDTADCYVNFTVPSLSQNIYCIPRLNQTDNSSFAIFESFHEDYGTAGGTPSSGNAPFTTQLQATPNKGYKFTNWSVYHDGKQVATLTEKNASYYVDGVYKFVANFEPATWDVTVETINPSDGGSVTGTGTQAEGSDVPISITCNEGYELDNWSYTTTDGINHSGTDLNFTIPKIKEDISLYVTFKSNKKKVEVRQSPADGGKVTIKKDGGTEEKVDYEEFINLETAVLNATPADGYEFLYWKNTTAPDTEEATNPYTYSVTSADTWTAYFAKKSLNIKTAVTPNAAGSVSINYDDISGTNKDSADLGDHPDVKLKSTIKLNATEKSSDYKFSRFVDSNNNIIDSGNNPATVTNVTKDETYTAVFVPNTAKISLRAEPQISGCTLDLEVNGTSSTTPEETEVNYNDSLVLTGSAPGYILRYWKDQNGVQYDGASISTVAKYGDQIFTAYFIKSDVDLTVEVSPAGAGSFTLNGGTSYSDKNDYRLSALGDYTLKATENSGYVFDKFVDVKSGATLSANTSNETTITSLDEDKKIIVYFTEQLFTASVAVNNGGSATINGKYGSDKVKPDSSVTLEATPAHGYLFKGWYPEQNGQGTQISSDSTYTYSPISGDKTFYAYFEPAEVEVTLDLTPADSGSVKLYGNSPITTRQTYKVPGSSTITMQAYPATGKKFSQWIEDKGGGLLPQHYTNNPLTITDVNANVTYTAEFVDAKSTITVDLNPSDGGTASVSSEGSTDTSLEIINGKKAILRATPAEGYTFLYWTDSTGAQYTGRIGMDGGSTLTIDSVYKSETYTAHFVKKDLTILLEATPDGAGMVRLGNNPFSDEKVQYHVQGNSSIEISAQPKDPTKYQFERWENKNDPKEVYTTNPLTIVSVSKTMHYVAVFSPLDIGIKVEAMPASGGQVTKTYNSDGSIVIEAFPRNGYTFANWKKGDTLLTMGTKYTIAAEDVRDGDVYTAYFKSDGTYDARSDITKENFYREWRKVSDPNYTVTRETMEQQAYSVVAGLRQYNNSTPALKNYAAFSTARAYYESQLDEYDVKKLNGVFGDSELITVEGEILHPDLLPDYESYEEKAEAFTFKKFGKKYETEILTVKRIFEPEDFNNKKRTYLWRYTGALDKDNIYLLYSIDGKKELWATPIVDEDGVLKFTIDELKDNDVVAVVRVKIK